MKKTLKIIIVKCLEWEARLVLWRFKPQIAAVTGSVGKTSTKDALGTALGTFFHIRKSHKSFNSEIGIPLTILGLDSGWNSSFIWGLNLMKGLLVLIKKEYPEWLVLEVAADHPGDIEKVTHWLKPDLVVITQFSKVPVHIEHFGSREAIVREKSFLVRALKQNGALILNQDDDDVAALKEISKSRTFFFGFREDADIVVSHEQIEYRKDGSLRGVSCKLNYEGNSVPVLLEGIIGFQLLYPVAAALTAVMGLNRNVVDAAQSFSEFEPPAGRMRIIEGMKGTTIIDDSYNSSPIALSSALRALALVECKGKKIAVLGDMLELGDHTAEEHRKAGAFASKICDIILTVGVRARYIAEGAEEAGMDKENIIQFTDAQKAGKALEFIIGDGDVVLIKGSQGSGMHTIRTEQAVKEIMMHPENAEELLVRQGKEWD